MSPTVDSVEGSFHRIHLPLLLSSSLLSPTYRSHGFVVGHIVPEAQVGGPIALVQDGDTIHIDAEKNTIDVTDVTEEEWETRRKAWKAPPLKVDQGTLFKYTKLVSDASHGCVTDA